MSAVTTWSLTANDNNQAPPNGWPEGQSAASVNNCARQMMSDLVREFQVGAVKVLASVAGTNTVTGSLTPDLASYSAGMTVILTPANTNTGATTLNIDSLGALDVQKYDGEALVAGDLVSGVPALLVLDSGADDWILLNPQSQRTTTPNVSAEEFGYKGVPDNPQSGNYTLVLSDAGKMIRQTSLSAFAWTVPPNSSVAFPVGTAITLSVPSTGGAITVTQGAGVTIQFAGTTSTTGNRTLSAIGLATLVKVATDTWLISGSGLS